MEPTAPRHRWSFGLRTMLLGVTIAGGPLAWVGYQLNWIRERADFLAGRGEVILRWSSPEAPGFLWVFGERGYRTIDVQSRDDVQDAVRLFPEADLLGPDGWWHQVGEPFPPKASRD